MSDSTGFVYDPDGISQDKLEYVKQFRAEHRKISQYTQKYRAAVFTPVARPWTVKVDCAFPCATQNELDRNDADRLIANGVRLVAEGANMPTTPEATEKFRKSEILFAPGKASNAGGVSVSGLEMCQNSERLSWPKEEVDGKLRQIMKRIHDNAYDTAVEFGMKGNYVTGANIAGFVKVARAMMAQGLV
jgi:glutamate dehydrogenase (NADP+)